MGEVDRALSQVPRSGLAATSRRIAREIVWLTTRIDRWMNVRLRHSYWRLLVVLQRERWLPNHKRIYWLHCEKGLSIQTKTPRQRRCCRYRVGRPEVGGDNDTWAMDFVTYRLFDGRPFRFLTIFDCHARETLATCARINFRAYQVIDELDRLARIRDKPRSIRVDNGPDFAGRMLDHWAYLNKIELDCSMTGKPTDNGFIEVLNGRLHAACLNASWFISMADAWQRIEEWTIEYSNDRPHMASAA